MTKKKVIPITPSEIYKAEATRTPIEFIKMKDVFNMEETVLKVEYKQNYNKTYAKIFFENVGNVTTIEII